MMMFRWRSISRILLILLVICWVLQAQSPASVSPGAVLMEQAKQQRNTQQFQEAAAKALEASRVFLPQSDWLSWGSAYEEIYQCVKGNGTNEMYRQWLPEFDSATKILALHADIPPQKAAWVWCRKGYMHHFLGEYEPAVKAYETAIPLGEQTTDTSLLLRLYANTGTIYWSLGDDYRALGFLEKAYSLAVAQQDTPFIAAVLSNMGNCWRTLQSPRAIESYEQSLKFQPERSETWMLLSKAHLEIDKKYDKALLSANESLKYATDEVEKADALHQLGRVSFDMANYNQAIAYYRKAIVFGRSGYGDAHPELARIYVFLANALVKKGDYNGALAASNQTMDMLSVSFNPTNNDQNPLEEDLTVTSLWILDALMNKADIYRERFEHGHQDRTDLQRSLRCAELGMAYLQKIRLRYGEDESKFEINEYVRPVCETALRTAFRLYKFTGDKQYAARAFSISEQTKAVTLAEALYRKEIKQVAGVPAELLERERQCQLQVAFWEKKCENPADIIAKDSLFIVKQARDALERQMQEHYPVYGKDLYGYRLSVSPDSVRLALPTDAALVEYYLGDSTLYTFLLTRDTFWVGDQPIAKDFNQQLTGFRKSAGDWRFSADSSAQASRQIFDLGTVLYDQLLRQPLSLAAKSPRLFIIPDGALHFLPFEVLPTSPYSGKWIDRDAPYLIKEKAVSYRFSTRLERPSQLSEGWGGWGLEYNDADLSTVSTAGNNPFSGVRNSGKLPFAADEIMAVSGLVGGAFWLNGEATRDNFLKNAQQYGILHLAMHGFVDEKNPLRSRLLFSQSVAGADPFVYASDLYNMQLRAGLAVLSTCQSGAGAWKHGEGVMSLSRAFAFAGCPSMVVGMWNVSDQSTSDLMVEFYKQLKQGKTKDEALRQAKLHYLETASAEYAKPVYWAGFVPVGEMDAFPEGYFTGKWKRWVWGLALAGLVLVLLVIFQRNKFSKMA